MSLDNLRCKILDCQACCQRSSDATEVCWNVSFIVRGNREGKQGRKVFDMIAAF